MQDRRDGTRDVLPGNDPGCGCRASACFRSRVTAFGLAPSGFCPNSLRRTPGIRLRVFRLGSFASGFSSLVTALVFRSWPGPARRRLRGGVDA